MSLTHELKQLCAELGSEQGMELPLLLILLLGVAGRGGALSVNEALNASQKISPQCRNGKIRLPLPLFLPGD